MKVTQLLKQKREAEDLVKCIETAIDSVKGQLSNSRNFSDIGTVGLYVDATEFRVKIKKEFMQEALEKQLKVFQSELDPIANKLAAIEMMLNS